MTNEKAIKTLINIFLKTGLTDPNQVENLDLKQWLLYCPRLKPKEKELIVQHLNRKDR